MSSSYRESTLKISTNALSILDRARNQKGWTRQSTAWLTAANTSLATIKRFWRQHPIRQDTFIDICGAVGVNWKEVTETIPAKEPYIKWGEAPDVSFFCGRTRELDELKRWLVEDRCRLVGLWGVGGIGKTSLAVKLAQQVQSKFDYIMFTSLRQSPRLTELLAIWLNSFAQNSAIDLPNRLDDRLSLLIRYLRRYNCLIILDSLESILSSGTLVGHYPQDYKVYSRFLKQIGELNHQSCFLLASREKPWEFSFLEGQNLPVRSYLLSGLGNDAKAILQSKGLSEPEQWDTLIEICAGNPSLLKMIAAFIKEVFDGNVSEFLKQGTTQVSRDISTFIQEQLERLSESERRISYQLATAAKPISIHQLESSLQPMPAIEISHAIASLARRSFLDKSTEGFTLKLVFKDYLSNALEANCQFQVNPSMH
ncbi:NB-ARC domain-containing protein [Roseofilum casamattae]|uniref:NB-ARC domain-containing protein n=1 Tax=Roseofilum casamattae BLCC-M143 TaxID=3022442 RepID=A0ABT7BU30_9CYAN|nr:NB-ARC domain-containing protein [Roseofilum casamattae]MDJ1182585.1 NB-ARC domain-containing protein [Roseofilum casamattae BLCC-M143]